MGPAKVDVLLEGILDSELLGAQKNDEKIIVSSVDTYLRCGGVLPRGLGFGALALFKICDFRTKFCYTISSTNISLVGVVVA